MVKDLSVKLETSKLLEENTEKSLTDIGFGDNLGGMPPNATVAKTDKWVYSKLKSFCTAKEFISEMKMQPTKWEKKKLQTIHRVRG